MAVRHPQEVVCTAARCLLASQAATERQRNVGDKRKADSSQGLGQWRKRRQLNAYVLRQRQGHRPWAGLGCSPRAINPSCSSPNFINGPTNRPVKPDGERNEKVNRWRWTGGDAAGSGITGSTPVLCEIIKRYLL
ncbi:unnamed protein product [Tetraodon nigroviridis]|uniref:(spotted green pufferfish) hypothetical protein n=1 Tax=Tetraodon nigroviridis TaxID=99883 RepID=Q4T727_TETNG|nr:unnamed protein product [Tetraodon nigroviridis]